MGVSLNTFGPFHVRKKETVMETEKIKYHGSHLSRWFIHFIHRRYILYLSFYTIVLFIIVSVILLCIYELLPDDNTFHVNIDHAIFEREAFFNNTSNIDAHFYGNDITFVPKRLQLSFDIIPNDYLYIIDPTGKQSVTYEPLSYSKTLLSGPIWIHSTEDAPSLLDQILSTEITPFLSLTTSGMMEGSNLVIRKDSSGVIISVLKEDSSRNSASNLLSTIPALLCFSLDINGNCEIKFNLNITEYSTNASVSSRGHRNPMIDRLIVPSSGASIMFYTNDTTQETTPISFDINIDETETDYKLNTTFAGSSDFFGDGILYYSFYTNTKEYPLYMQRVQMDNAYANLNVECKKGTTSIELHGSADDVMRSGVSVTSVFSWFFDNVAILPTFLLTVFGGAITISLRMWEKANARASAAKPEACPCEPTPQRRRGNPQVRRPASIYTRRKARADREKRIAASADASPQ